MIIAAFIKDGQCVNIADFESHGALQELREAFLADSGADDLLELPPGFGVGDYYDGAAWSLANPPVPPEELPEAPKYLQHEKDQFLEGMMEGAGL